MTTVRAKSSAGTLDETFVDAIYEPPKVFTYGGMIANVLTFAAHRRTLVLGILADRAVTGVGEQVEFFGRQALLPSAAVVLSLRTGAPLVPCFAGRSDGQLTATFEPPLDIPNTGDRAADVREGVQRFARVLERYVRRNPEQWTVFEDFWRGSR